MSQLLTEFIEFMEGIHGEDKERLIKLTKEKFSLTQDRKVYYRKEFAVRFSYTANWTFSNTILSLSHLQKYDDRPFIVCLITKEKNILYLSNTTFLKKISHSSHELSTDNIKWSFNGSDIVKEYSGKLNEPTNFEFLFDIHKEISFEENLLRLVESTNWIAPSWCKFEVKNYTTLFHAPSRAEEFVKSDSFKKLKKELDDKVEKYKNEILIAAFIDNVNIRWRLIEYLIAWDDEELKQKLIDALHKKDWGLPRAKSKNSLWDYQKIFDAFYVETDIKTKIMILNSNPKAYNIDKLLEFLSQEKTVFLFYFIWIEPNKIVSKSLVSIFQKELQESTIFQKHWASRSSRWVAQFNWKVIEKLIKEENNQIDIEKSKKFLEELMAR